MLQKMEKIRVQEAYTLRELSHADDDTYFVLQHLLNPKMDRPTYNARLKKMRESGYRAVAMFDVTGRMVAATGFWISARFYCGFMMHMDNFVVLEELRSAGIGRQLLAWLEDEARREGCEAIILDSYVENHLSHKFYFREGFKIVGHHFHKAV